MPVSVSTNTCPFLTAIGERGVKLAFMLGNYHSVKFILIASMLGLRICGLAVDGRDSHTNRSVCET